VGGYAARGGVVMVVSSTSLAAVELAFVAIALAALEAAVAVVTGATNKGGSRHDFFSLLELRDPLVEDPCCYTLAVARQRRRNKNQTHL
jgi:hypothetical protein